MNEQELQELIDNISGLTGDAKTGAIDALKRILAGRMSGQVGGGIGILRPKKIKIDPDLDEPDDPESKPDDDLNDTKINFDDPDNLLKSKKDSADKENSEEETEETNDDEPLSPKAKDKTPEQEDKPSETKDNKGKDDKKNEDGSDDINDTTDGRTPDFSNPTEEERKKTESIRRKVEANQVKSLAETAAEKAKELEKEGKCSKEEVKSLEELAETLNKEYEKEKNGTSEKSIEEFEDMIQKALDLIDKVLEVNYSANVEARFKKFEQDIEDDISNFELNSEDESNLGQDPNYKKITARNAEKDRYNDLISKSSHLDGGIEQFKKDLLNAINDQIEDKLEEYEDETYALSNRHHEDDDIVSPATRSDVRGLPVEERPIVDIYFDQSGSWRNDDVKVGMKAIAEILKLEKEELLKINIWYFSEILSQDQSAARANASEECWDLVIDNIMAEPKTNNVIIMTDSDIQYDYGHHGHHGCIAGKGGTVDGCVWFLWRHSDSAVPEAAVKLRGKKGTFQYYVYKES